uniref:Coxsackievirus and adenovirus receptor homolog n=1 Tax=Seriola dumerili TaxID=41447 RepID=A0A3B4VA13_SERDU
RNKMCAQGMQVTSTGPQTIQTAEGEGVTLGCRYTPGTLDTGELDIEWSMLSPDTTQKDQMLMSYSSGTKYLHGNHALAKGLSFTAHDPSMGDASLSIALLSPAHSATYQCKVKKSPGVDMRKVSLVVMVKPSAPKCWVEGGELVGEAVALHCQSAKGSTPLKYTWRRESAGPIPATATQNSVTGELKISNHSQSFAGIYRCEVNNAVGTEHCMINLRANKHLDFILLSRLSLWLCHNLFIDVPPPESRPVSRHTSRSTNQHPQVTYCQVGGTEGSSFSEGCAHPRSSNSCTPVKCTPVEYDSKYGYAV